MRVPGCAWSGSILAPCNYYIARARLLSVSTQLMDECGRRMEKMWGFFFPKTTLENGKGAKVRLNWNNRMPEMLNSPIYVQYSIFRGGISNISL